MYPAFANNVDLEQMASSWSGFSMARAKLNKSILQAADVSKNFWMCGKQQKYWDILSIYHTCPKI